MSNKTKKQLLLNLPYFIAGLVCTNLGERKPRSFSDMSAPSAIHHASPRLVHTRPRSSCS